MNLGWVVAAMHLELHASDGILLGVICKHRFQTLILAFWTLSPSILIAVILQKLAAITGRSKGFLNVPLRRICGCPLTFVMCKKSL